LGFVPSFRIGRIHAEYDPLHDAVDVKKRVKIKAVVLSGNLNERSFESWPDTKRPAFELTLGGKIGIFALSPRQFVKKFFSAMRFFLHVAEVTAKELSECFVATLFPAVFFNYSL